MSSDLSAIHAQTSAILEKLYEERGQPDELNEAFIHEYFELVKEDLNLDDEGGVAPFVTERAEMKFSEPHKGLIEIDIPDQKVKFVVSDKKPVKIFSVNILTIGHYRGEGSYAITNVSGICNITLKTGSALYFTVLGPCDLEPESGTGEWVDA